MSEEQTSSVQQNGIAELFESNEGWLVTSNENEECKIAKINEDSDIFDGNREWQNVETENYQDEASSTEVLKGAAKLFIGDLLRAESRDNYFKYKSINFNKVHICGTVIAAYPHNDKHSVIIDDGTSNITCFFTENESLRELKDRIVKEKEEMEQLILEAPDDRLLKVAYLMSRNSFLKIKQVPFTYKDLKLGDTVTIIGKIKQYSNNRFIFASKIINHEDDSDVVLNHMKDLFYLYEKIY